MKTIHAAVASAMILLGFVASTSVMAGPYGHSGYHGYGGYYGSGSSVRFTVGVGVGFPYWGYGYYPPPYYYYYPPYYAPAVSVVTVPYTPPTYIQQPALAPQSVPAPQGFWYYCAESNGYYPYVAQCARGWQRVSPTPPPG